MGIYWLALLWACITAGCLSQPRDFQKCVHGYSQIFIPISAYNIGTCEWQV